MTKTAVGAADPGGTGHVTVSWHIEEWMGMLHQPFWAISEMRYDEPAALDRLRTLRIKHNDRQWRVKKVTTITTEEVLDA